MLGRLIAAAVALMAADPAWACTAPVSACERASAGALALIAPGQAITLVVADGETPAVRRAAADVRGDLATVGGQAVTLANALPARAPVAVIAGTVGTPMIDALAKSGKIDLTGLAGQWEGYVEQVVDNPAPGIARALVIAGSDRRGTVFGLYDLSTKIGVSPWGYWADVPPHKHARLWLTAGRVADHPAVKYRGIFLNDEEPALGTWARTRFGGVNRAFYEKVFTLLLRQKANFLWPAMWGKSIWEDDPTAAPLADEMGVVLGTSHHEPMGRAQSDWKRHGTGPWDYTRNAEALRRFWRDGMKRRGNAETLVTIGMRGDGDEPMTEGTATQLLERIVADQRRMIGETTGKPPEATPQVWALYKEVQDYYDKGMRVPNDVTLLFSDDNWGNLRRLPDPAAARRAGGYGIYYHFDYVGGPRNYKWLDTNNIARVWQQMDLAREARADRLWVVNVGDLKPMEMPIGFFLAMAWNPAAMTQGAMERFPAEWAAQQFGPRQGAAIGDLLTRYGRLAAFRKPELIDATSFTAPEWADRVGRWDALERDAQRIGAAVPAERRDAYYEIVLHRVEAMANLYRLHAAVARTRSSTGAEKARWGAEARRLFANDGEIRRRYEVDTAGGKWTGMMAQTHISYTGWQQPEMDVLPALDGPVAAPAEPAPQMRTDRPTRMVAGRGIAWRVVPGLGRDGPGLVAAPALAAAVEKPGGDSPRLEYRFTAAKDGAVTIRVETAPGLDVRGRGQHRYAVSVDGGPVTTVDLLAGETEESWGKAVADNQRVGTTPMTVSRGVHTLSIWLVDSPVVFTTVSVTPNEK
ncbi:glycosyl hydrolase 115 family protein [Sphingomonas aerophila]|uniref:Gylcosyl hydrolase 115 C-terminal domain-containing protein n=1 Tax=Sphingomonas aerophila TaxID=1344948 RepID=A0A7W9BD40_9SPHN|nr:glycosyl hydrolase 115 family protein [Sphingomonas aerophila]MBB5715002.1 hypothetical protein [Sphingomonas aerophila]